jgi:hypothetical protein
MCRRCTAATDSIHTYRHRCQYPTVIGTGIHHRHFRQLRLGELTSGLEKMGGPLSMTAAIVATSGQELNEAKSIIQLSINPTMEAPDHPSGKRQSRLSALGTVLLSMD